MQYEKFRKCKRKSIKHVKWLEESSNNPSAVAATDGGWKERTAVTHPARSELFLSVRDEC